MIEKCPDCGSGNIKNIVGNLYRCGDCGHKFTENGEKYDGYWKRKVEQEDNEQACKQDQDDEEDETGDGVGDPDDMDIIFMGGL